ncbi:SusF/SusE family outer membrane protein [Marinoscillum sp.]|uniref:SusF/SusE family outer membrane protein n=1 Tax=Marinoscillum sp. TaxID=2024838 RepID=UPI003BACAA7F
MKKLNEILGKLIMVFAVIFAMSACDTADDVTDEIDDIINEGPSLDDGYYIVGSAISADTTDANMLVSGQVNGPDFGAQDRSGFFEAYVYMGSGDFSFMKVAGEEITEFGGSYEEVVDGDPAELNIYVGAYSDGGSASAPFDGLVHVMIDETTGQFVIIPVHYWEIIGGATEGGWGSGQEIALKSASADEVVFEGTKIVLREGDFKFRFDGNWSMNLEEGDCDVAETACLNYFTNFGGTVDELVHGGGNIVFDGTEGEYTITITYKPGEGNSITAKLERTGDVEPLPEYPDELYMVGATIGGWDWEANGIQMIPVHSNPHLFWRIVWMDADAADPGVKFAPQPEWNGDFGISGEATDGVFAKGSDNVPAPAASGYYTIVVNLEAETVEVNAPMVYGIGDAFGGWDAATEAFLFTVDNDNMVLNSMAFVADAELRIHVTASTMTKSESTDAVDWWQAEFVPIDGTIEYRGTGGDQARTNVTTGQTVSLNFKDGTATIQ